MDDGTEFSVTYDIKDPGQQPLADQPAIGGTLRVTTNLSGEDFAAFGNLSGSAVVRLQGGECLEVNVMSTNPLTRSASVKATKDFKACND